MFMRVRLLMLVCATAVMETEARATDLNAGLPYQPSPDPYGYLHGEDPTSIWALFHVAFDHRATGVFGDRFQPFNVSPVNALWTGRDFDHLPDYNVSLARNAFASSLRLSARDTVLDLDLPIIAWLRERPGFFASFLWNSLDNADEESVSPFDPSYRSVARSWWRALSEDGHLRYGLRPFRNDPYAYLGWSIKDRERVLLLGDARYYFKNFGDHRFELTLSAPVTRNISLELGTSYQFGTHQTERRTVLKLLKTFKSGGTLHVALEVREHPMAVAGITLPWG